MDNNTDIWKLTAEALVAKRIARDYVTLRRIGSSIEFEGYVKRWLEQNVSEFDEDFHNGVLKEFIKLMREKSDHQ